MKKCQLPPLLLCLAALLGMNIPGCSAAEDDQLVKNLTTKPLQVMPYNKNSANVTKLVIEGGQILLNEADRLALASYPILEELHLDGNLVTGLPAKYFSVVPHLRVLSLSRNRISSLDPEAFSGLDFLTKLDLSHNLLTSLHTRLYEHLNKLQTLNLQGNPWNCSCLLLSSAEEDKTSSGSTGPTEVSCNFVQGQIRRDVLQATAVCDPSTIATDKLQESPTTDTFHQSTTPMITATSQSHIDGDHTPAISNIWKFTVCVATLAACSFMLILCGIKGPSWYKLCHNYRHRRLRQEEEEEGTVTTVFTGTGRHVNQQTLTFERQNRRIVQEDVGEEDEYYEDPYIKREE